MSTVTTIDQLEEELDRATEEGDVEKMDEILLKIDQLEEDGTLPESTPKPDVAASESDDKDEAGASSSAEDEKAKETDDQPAGIATKNGKGVIPYSELEKERTEKAELQQKLDELQSKSTVDQAAMEQLEYNKRLVKELTNQIETNGLQPNKLPEELDLDVAGFLAKFKEADEYGEVGGMQKATAEFVANLAKQNAYLMEQLKQNRSTTPTGNEQAANDPQAIVNANPDLSRWNQSDLAWEEVLKVDAYIKTLPDYAGKSLSERTPKIVEMVKQRLGEAPAKPSTDAPGKTAEQVIAESQRNPTSLTDIGGIDKGAQATFAERTQDMDDMDILAELERETRSGKSIDDLFDQMPTGTF